VALTAPRPDLAVAACCLPGGADLEAELEALAAAAAPAIETLPDGTRRLGLVVETLDCAACLPAIERSLSGIPGLRLARVNLTTRRLTLQWDQGAPPLASLLRPVLAQGHRLAPFAPGALDRLVAEERRLLLRCLGVAGFAAANVMLLSVSVWAGLWGEGGGDMGPATRQLLHWLSAMIAVPAVLYVGRPFFRSALAALKAARLNMDVPIALAVTLATGLSLLETLRGGRITYFDAALSLLFFLLLGRLLDHAVRARARSAAENLLALQAASAGRLLPDGQVERVALEALAAGDTLLVAAGERLPADGVVTLGRSDLDASLLTGETLPQAVAPGAAVHAGTLNLTRPLRIRVTAVGQESLLARLHELVETAEQGRAGAVRLADRVARLYAPAVHALALVTALGGLVFALAWQDAVTNAIAVLLVTCPCAIGLAVPAVQVAAVGRLYRRGVLVKRADALERLAEVDHVVFDKTGTLTLNGARLANAAEIAPADLALAAALAQASRHPLARALVAAAGPVAALPVAVEELPGAGLLARLPAGELRLGSATHVGLRQVAELGGPTLWLRRVDGGIVRFRFAERPRPDAAQTLRRLRSLGLTVELLSGDRPAATRALAESLGIETWQGGVSPEGKHERLRALAGAGRRVLMVGDGLNDAAALTVAAASMAPAQASDVAQSAADLVFLGDALAPVAEAVAVARRARRLVRQNFLFALGYNLLAVPLAMAGLVTPLLAAILMSGSSLTVTGNALRLTAGR
jgi:Cu2+-exporting ATPase